MMSIVKLSLAILSVITLSGCFETKEEREDRLAQFNGQTLNQVSEKIGEPDLQDKSKAIWNYKEIRVYKEPIYHYINGFRIRTGYYSDTEKFECKFTATLSGNRVKSSMYEGNSCRRFAPKIKTKA